MTIQTRPAEIEQRIYLRVGQYILAPLCRRNAVGSFIPVDHLWVLPGHCKEDPQVYSRHEIDAAAKEHGYTVEEVSAYSLTPLSLLFR